MKGDGMQHDHVLLLIKSVIKNFIKIRMHYIAKESNQNMLKSERVREKYSKLILFKNQ